MRLDFDQRKARPAQRPSGELQRFYRESQMPVIKSNGISVPRS